MLTIEQLLQPRYRVIATYPLMPCKMGEIISFKDGKAVIADTGHFYSETSAQTFALYPHLFELCHWSDNRLKGEFPEYVAFTPKFKPEIIYKVSNVFLNSAEHVVFVECEDENDTYPPSLFQRPATKEEYEAYKNK